ncbi:MAG: hypothetical protein IT233_12680 [Bacteroidia bacterium]|nr:hypothetical protein [Bacteroidia bacterium]
MRTSYAVIQLEASVAPMNNGQQTVRILHNGFETEDQAMAWINNQPFGRYGIIKFVDKIH